MNCDLCILLSYMLRMLCQYDSKLVQQSDNQMPITSDQRPVLSVQRMNTKGQAKQKWSYEGETGPDHWPKNFPQCGGKRQSPINIMTTDLHHVTWLPQFEFINYDKLSGDGMTPAFLHLRNNGHTASMTIDDDVYLRGSNLGELYRAVEVHFHWGPDNGVGSEHLLDDHHHPLEVHIVHYNTKYKTLSAAKQQPDGLAVIAVFADISEVKNPAFELIASALDQVTEYNQKTIVTGLRPIDILPNDTSKYYHYAGSLTTPPCYESVSWYVMHEGIKVTQDQMNRLRHLKEHVEEGHGPHKVLPTSKPQAEMLKVNIAHNNTMKVFQNHHSNRISYIRYNYRPCQPLHGRKVYCSHPAMVKYKSFLPEFSVGDIAVNHHVSNLGDHDLSKALLQDTRSGFHHSIGSSLSNHPHEGHEMRSTLNIHSHTNNHQPKRMEIDFSGKSIEQERITDALHGHLEGPPDKILPKDLKKIFAENHIPDFQQKLKPEDIYKIFGNIFLRQAQILSAQQTLNKVDTKLFAEPEIKEFANKEEYKVNRIHTPVKNQEEKSTDLRHEPQPQEKPLPKEQAMPKPHGGEVSEIHRAKPKPRDQDAKNPISQNVTKEIKSEIAMPVDERQPSYKAVKRRKGTGHSFNLSAEVRNTYSARKRNKLGNAGFHFSVLKPSYQQHSGEISANYPVHSLVDNRKNRKFISRPAKNYKGSQGKMKKTDITKQKTDKNIIDLISENNFDVLESDAVQLQKPTSFETATPRVDGSPGFGAKHFTRVSLNSLGLEKSAVFHDAMNNDLSGHKFETFGETEKTTIRTTTSFDTTEYTTVPTTPSPEDVTTSSILTETTETVRTTLGNHYVRFPILRERNATSIPIRNMLHGYHNMLSMLTDPTPSKDQKPHQPL